MLGRIVDEDLALYVGRRGGAAALRYRGPGASDRIRLELDFPPDGYRADLVSAFADEMVRHIVSEEDREGWNGWLGRGHRETRLHRQEPGQYAVPGRLIEVLRGCRVFHFHDTGADAAVKQKADPAQNSRLLADAGNLASYPGRATKRLRANSLDGQAGGAVLPGLRPGGGTAEDAAALAAVRRRRRVRCRCAVRRDTSFHLPLDAAAPAGAAVPRCPRRARTGLAPVRDRRPRRPAEERQQPVPTGCGDPVGLTGEPVRHRGPRRRRAVGRRVDVRASFGGRPGCVAGGLLHR